MLEFLSDVGARIESTCAYVVYTPVLAASYVWIAVSLFKKANGDFLRLIILSCFSAPSQSADLSELKHQLEEKPIVGKRVDVSENQNLLLLTIIMEAIKQLPHTNFYTILAHRIKRVADQRLGESWCCIVGSNFSLNSNNTRSLGYAHYTIGPYVNIVVYRTSKPDKKKKEPIGKE
ncbi:hypothetical protein M3Y99_00740200 [Aphelenchoides fujianensis]|nr:hypothetical protein M3Y99_00740200 [Aphelenchoides fujianensis]